MTLKRELVDAKEQMLKWRDEAEESKTECEKLKTELQTKEKEFKDTNQAIEHELIGKNRRIESLEKAARQAEMLTATNKQHLLDIKKLEAQISKLTEEKLMIETELH